MWWLVPAYYNSLLICSGVDWLSPAAMQRCTQQNIYPEKNSACVTPLNNLRLWSTHHLPQVCFVQFLKNGACCRSKFWLKLILNVWHFVSWQKVEVMLHTEYPLQWFWWWCQGPLTSYLTIIELKTNTSVITNENRPWMCIYKLYDFGAYRANMFYPPSLGATFSNRTIQATHGSLF